MAEVNKGLIPILDTNINSYNKGNRKYIYRAECMYVVYGNEYKIKSLQKCAESEPVLVR